MSCLNDTSMNIKLIKLNALILDFSALFFVIDSVPSNKKMKLFFKTVVSNKQDCLIKHNMSLLRTGVCLKGTRHVPINHSQTFCI